MIGFLIEGDELIFHHGHTFPQVRRTFAPHLVLCYDPHSGKAIRDKSAFPAVLHDQRCGRESGEATVERSVNAALCIAEISQERYAQDIKANNPETKLRLQCLQTRI